MFSALLVQISIIHVEIAYSYKEKLMGQIPSAVFLEMF